MGVEARSISPVSGAPKRQLKNYLLDARFQLKYTGMVVGVTMLVATILGYFAYGYSQGQTRALQVQMLSQENLSPDVQESLLRFAEEEDRKVLTWIIAGILLMGTALGATGIVVTHRLVGPAYKMKMLIRKLASGKLRVDGSLRKGDELQDVFLAFADMVNTLRSKQADEIAQLDAALARARASGTPEDVVRVFQELRDRMQSELE